MLHSILLQPWLDNLAQWWDRHEPIFWQAVVIYLVFFMIVEMIVHEFGHYYFQRKFGVGVEFFKIGIFSLYSKTLENQTKFILGIPILMAESRGVGELGASEADKTRGDAFYNPQRHPRERFFIAIGGAATVLLVCSVIFMIYGLGYWLFWITVPKTVLICFGFVVVNQLFNVLIPLRFSSRYATDGWVAAESLIAWYKWNRKKI